MPFPRRVVPSAILAAALCACGCGNPGPPSPPSLLLPQPAGDLSAERTGNTVTLRWTAPERSTDRVMLRGSQPAKVCRALENGPCEPAGSISTQPGSAAEYHDALPPALTLGPPRLLTYRVRFGNRKGVDAGPSNPAFTAAGAAPPALHGAAASAAAGGIAIRWTAVGALPAAGSGQFFARLERQESGAGRGARPIPVALDSALNRNWLPLETLDRGAVTGRRYSYRVALAERVLLAGHLIEIAGESAAAPELLVRDTFPPRAPVGLEAAADANGGTIDLSWTPNTEPDLAGYFVYRRAAAGGEAVRVSGPKPIAAPGWSDPGAARGVRYAYSVSAVDASGNESPRSGESSESLP